MVASPIFKLAGKLASNLASRSGSGLPRIEKIFGTPPRVPSPTTIEKIARSDEAFARGPVEYSRYKGPMEDVDEVILDAPLNISEREYFRNLPRTGSGFTEKKLTAKDVEFFEDMMREGDPYDFMADIPSAKIRTDKKGNKYLRVQGEEDMNNLFKFIEDGPWDKGDLPPSLRRWDWDKSFKDVKEFKHGGGLSSINKPITINGQPHNLAWINPDEASVLKAMGGSGKKVGGIPAYFDAWSMGLTPTPEEQETVPEPDHPDDYPDWPSDKTKAELPKAFTYETGVAKEDQDDFWNRPSDDPTEYQKIYDRPELNVYKTKLIERLGVPGMESYMKGLGTSGLRQMIDKFHTGYDFGGPMGTMEGIQRNIASDYAKKLKLKEHLEKLKGLKEDDTLSEEDMEERREELISAFKDHAKEIGGKFIPSTKFGGIMSGWEDTLKRAGKEDSLFHKGLGYFAPGKIITDLGAIGLNALTKAFGVIGEFITPEGLSYRVMDDGTLVASDIYADTDEGTVEVDETGEAVVAPTSETVAEVEAGPMETFQTGLQSIESNEGINNSIQILMDQYGISEGEARVMLGLDINVA